MNKEELERVKKRIPSFYEFFTSEKKGKWKDAIYYYEPVDLKVIDWGLGRVVYLKKFVRREKDMLEESTFLGLFERGSKIYDIDEITHKYIKDKKGNYSLMEGFRPEGKYTSIDKVVSSREEDRIEVVSNTGRDIYRLFYRTKKFNN